LAVEATSAREGLSDLTRGLLRAVELLDWQGIVIPELDLLGDRVCIVASLYEPEHERRQAAGLHALADPWLLELDEGPSSERQARWRASPVHLVGVLVWRRTWRSALTTASGFAAFGARAVVLPREHARNRRLSLEAAVCGVGVIARDALELQLLQPPTPVPATQARRSLVHRLIEERVYERLLASLVSVG